MLRSINVEIKGLQPVEKGDWEAKVKAYDAAIVKLGQDIEWAETTGNGGQEAPKKKSNNASDKSCR